MFIDYNSYFCTLLVYNITIDWLIDTTRSFFPLGADFSWLLVGKFCPCCFHWLIEHNKTGNTLSSKTVEQAVNQCSLNECFRENQEDYRVLEIPTCSSIHDLWGKRRFFFLRNEWNPNESLDGLYGILEIATVLIPFTSLSQKFQEIEDILPHTESFQHNSEMKWHQNCMKNKNYIPVHLPNMYKKKKKIKKNKKWPHVEHFVFEMK